MSRARMFVPTLERFGDGSILVNALRHVLGQQKALEPNDMLPAPDLKGCWRIVFHSVVVVGSLIALTVSLHPLIILVSLFCLATYGSTFWFTMLHCYGEYRHQLARHPVMLIEIGLTKGRYDWFSRWAMRRYLEEKTGR